MAVKEYNGCLKCDRDCFTLCGIIFGFICAMAILAIVTFTFILEPEGKYNSINNLQNDKSKYIKISEII